MTPVNRLRTQPELLPSDIPCGLALILNAITIKLEQLVLEEEERLKRQQEEEREADGWKESE